MNNFFFRGILSACMTTIFLLACCQLQVKAATMAGAPAVKLGRAGFQTPVKGRITDSKGEPVAGVTIREKRTDNSTGSNAQGEFEILLKNNKDAILVLSYVGYISKEVPVTGNTLTVVMEEGNTNLDEVVITGFGLSQKKESLTGAISVVGAADISRSVSSTTSGALVGKVPGLNSRQSDGRPGASTALQIRNMGDPLYVIDGVQKDAGQFNNLDFNDIESISILKDASAAIYGVRAANGVIVVTTKKGKRNTKNTISVTGNYGFQNLSTFPRPASAEEYVSNYIQSETIQNKPRTYTPEDLEKWKQGTEKGYVPFDWYNYIWKTSPQQYINASVSGGSDKINYYFSAGHLNQDAIIANYGGFKRTNLQMSIESQISDRFKIGMSMNGRQETRVNPGVPGADDYWLPIFATYRNLPTRRPFANDNPAYPALTSTDPGTNFAWLNYDLSGKYQETWRVAQINFNAEYKIIEGLTAKALVGYFYQAQKLDNQEYTYKLYDYDPETDTYPVSFNNTNPWRERRMGYNEELNSNVQLAYNKAVNGHNIAVVAGVETITRKTPTTWVHSIPVSNYLHLIDYESMDTYDDDGDRTEARAGFIGRINYDYNGKYLVELSGRYDGSWKFPPDHRWGFFPSASIGWRISQEDFWKDSQIGNIVNDLKIRGSYGMLGQDDLGKRPGTDVDMYAPFDFLSGYTYKNGGSVLDGKYLLGTVPRPLPVTTLSWIKAKILNIGLDASFLNNRLTGTLEYFQRKRTGLPAQRNDVLVPGEVGFDLPFENLNSDANKGYEASLAWKDKINELSYSIGGNITYSRFYDWDQYKPRFSNSWDEYRNSLVERYGYLNWGLESDGQFGSWEEIAGWPIDNDRQGNKTLRPGDVKYVDQNGDHVINSMDERPIGYRQDSTPILNFGLNFGFAWRRFDLSFDLAGGGLSTFYMENEQRNPFHDGGNNSEYYMENTWHLSDITDPNSELIPGKYPTLLIGNSGHSNYWNSDFWKTNVKYVKLRNLEFGYSLPESILKPLSITNLRIYFSGQNLLTFSNVHDVDPEITLTSGLAYPTMRIYNFGLNLSF